MSTQITIIKVTPTVADTSTEDRSGGVEHGRVSKAIAATIGSLDEDAVVAGINKMIVQTQSMIAQLGAAAGQLKPSEITIGLAISAEGSIGIATAGAEVSVELTFPLDKGAKTGGA